MRRHSSAKTSMQCSMTRCTLRCQARQGGIQARSRAHPAHSRVVRDLHKLLALAGRVASGGCELWLPGSFKPISKFFGMPPDLVALQG